MFWSSLSASVLRDSHAISFFIVQLAVRTTILSVAAILCLQFTRRTSASNRHRICALALVGLVAFPWLSLGLAPWEIETHIPFLANIISLSSTTNTVPPSQSSQFSWDGAIVLLWSAGLLLSSGRSILGCLFVERCLWRSTPVDDSNWFKDLGAAAASLGMDPSAVRLRCCNVASALTCRVFRPVILLPETASGWSILRKRTVLLHELAHIRRRDCLFQYVAHAAQALFWFHPLVWWLTAKLYQEQELACDDLVVAAGVAPASYASVPLESARELSSTLLFACSMSGTASKKKSSSVLRHRFTHILSNRRNCTCDTRLATWLPRAVVGTLLLVCSMSPMLAEEIYRIGGDVSAPIILYKEEPKYTEEAKELKIEGTLKLSVVVGIDGRARDIQVVQSLDPGLDDSATQCVEKWRFKPGERHGKPVAVRANIEVNFHLR